MHILVDEKLKKGLSKQDLEALMRQWQKKMAMEDWVMDLQIADFKRSDGYRQSGDFVADPAKKTATILMTWEPWRGDEEYTLVHEMLHILMYPYDKFSDELLLKHYPEESGEHQLYLDKLEQIVHHLTRILVGRSDR